jgi:hypothetical protein
VSLMEDHLTKETVHHLHEKFLEGVLELPRTKAGDIGFNSQTFQQVGVPIVRFVHAKLWNLARPNQTGQLIDYPMVVEGSVNAILDNEGISHTKRKSKSTKLAGDVTRLLQTSGIAVYRRPKWYLKPFNEDRVEWVTHEQWAAQKDHKVEKRIEEFSDLPVNSKIDLRSIQRPKEFTPDEVAAFIERFVPAALKIQDQLEEVLQQIADAQQAELEQKEWQGLGSKMDKVFGG